MSSVNVTMVKGACSPSQKREIITELTETLVRIAGEATRQATSVTIEEVESGDVGAATAPATQAPATVAELIAAARTRIRNLSLDEFSAALANPDVVLVDVREPNEVAAGAIPGAISAPRGMLEFHADPASPYHIDDLRPDRPVVVYCKSGGRSALAAASLTAMGYTDVAHLDGGFMAWEQAQPHAGATT